MWSLGPCQLSSFHPVAQVLVPSFFCSFISLCVSPPCSWTARADFLPDRSICLFSDQVLFNHLLADTPYFLTFSPPWPPWYQNSLVLIPLPYLLLLYLVVLLNCDCPPSSLREGPSSTCLFAAFPCRTICNSNNS